MSWQPVTASHCPPPQGLASSAFGATLDQVTCVTGVHRRVMWRTRLSNWLRTGVSGMLTAAAVTFAATAPVVSLAAGWPVGGAVGLAAAGACAAKHVRARHEPVRVRVDAVAEAMVAACTGHDVRPMGPAHARAAVDGERLALQAEADGPIAEYGRGVTRWLEECILHFGRLDDTAADRQVLHKWLGGQMKAADVRNGDAVSWIPIILKLYFLPTVGELFANRLEASAAFAVIKAAGKPATRR